jgi:hypothetical protein
MFEEEATVLTAVILTLRRLVRDATYSVCLSILILTFAPPARAAFIDAQVAGLLFAPFGGGDGDQQTSSSLSVVIAHRDVQVGVSSWRGIASAAYGALGVATELNVVGGFQPRADGSARFEDTWTFTDRPLDTPGQLRVGIHFEGVAAQTSTFGGLNAIGVLNVGLSALDSLEHQNPIGGWNFSDRVEAFGGVELAAEDIDILSDPVPFLYGRPVRVDGSLGASVRGDLFATGAGQTDFSNTAAFTRLQVLDAQGNWTTAFNLETASGATYPFAVGPTPIPEPTTFALLLTGVAALVGATARADPVKRRRGTMLSRDSRTSA